jgi:hypothetical protein
MSPPRPAAPSAWKDVASLHMLLHNEAKKVPHSRGLTHSQARNNMKDGSL